MTDADHLLAMLVEMFGDVKPFRVIQRVALLSMGDLDAAVQTLLSVNDDESFDNVVDSTTTANASRNVNAPAARASGEPPKTISETSKRPAEFDTDILPESKKLRHDHDTLISSTPSNSPLDAQTTLKPAQPNALSILKWSSNASAKATAAPPHIQLTPDNVRDHVPCELFLNFIPAEVADALVVWLMDEAKTWKNPRFIINEKEVYGNHRSELYVEDVNGKHSYSWAGEEDKTVRPFTPLLSFVRDMVQKEVQRLGIEGWCSNAMVANEYRHGKEVTGAHTDKLTYLGPLPTIASVTLGAGRIFRIKRVPRPNGPSPQTYNVLLPHRSLLVMLPPMQEEYKHEIPPQKTVITHHISGEARYNLTFRMYRDDFRDPPSCKCNVTAELKPVLRQDTTFGRYYFHCPYGREPAGCGYFEWLDSARVPKRVPNMGLALLPGGNIEENANKKCD